MDKDITSCIVQLAERAADLGEPNTAVVLFALAGHRLVGADHAMSLVAKEQAELLTLVINANIKNNPPQSTL